MPSPAEVNGVAARLRDALAEPFPGERAAAAIAGAAHPDAATTSAIAKRLEWSTELLNTSFKALYAPFTRLFDLTAIAATLRPCRELVGFVMPGNLPGAGLHELVLTLLSGSVALVKTATTEPIFFARFAQRLTALDPRLGTRIAIFNWGRERADLTLAIRQICDRLIVLGDDDTIAGLSSAKPDSTGERRTDFVGFGERVSGVVLTAAAACHPTTARDVALDVGLFEQRGCLSPHHVFVADPIGRASRAFAEQLAESLRDLTAGPLAPPSRLALEDAATIRSLRERARWRAIGGRNVSLWEGPLPGWTAIYDRDAGFTMSPGFRTVFVSPFASSEDLAHRLECIRGRAEAFAFKSDPATDSPDHIAEIRSVVEQTEATYICKPGRMQSPPVDWPHGGGAFIRMLRGDR